MPKYSLQVSEEIHSLVEIEAETREEAERLFNEGDVQTSVRWQEPGDRVNWEVLDVVEVLDEG